MNGFTLSAMRNETQPTFVVSIIVYHIIVWSPLGLRILQKIDGMCASQKRKRKTKNKKEKKQQQEQEPKTVFVQNGVKRNCVCVCVCVYDVQVASSMLAVSMCI